MGIYMKYDNVKGSVTTDGFKGWIELSSFQWGMERIYTRRRTVRQRGSTASPV